MSLVNALSRTPRVVGALMLREMSTTYGKSPGGYLWAILEPTAGIVVLAFAFSLMVRSPPIGDNFMLFYATGVLPFGIFMELSNKVSSSISFSKALLAYPGVTFLDAILARFLLNALCQLLVSYIVMGGILLWYQPDLIFDPMRIVEAYALVMLLALGIGTLNCFLFSIYPLYRQLYSIATRPLMLVSAIFYSFASMPDNLQYWMWFNPIIHMVGLMRSGFYVQYDASYVSVTYALAFGAVPGVLGLFFLHRYYRVILYEI